MVPFVAHSITYRIDGIDDSPYSVFQNERLLFFIHAHVVTSLFVG